MPTPRAQIRLACSKVLLLINYFHHGLWNTFKITFWWVHGKTTDEWHTNDIRVHTSDIRMTYEYIRVTYGWHTSTYKWHTDDIRVHTITFEWHTDDIQVHMSDIRMTYEWHKDDMRFEIKIKLILFKLFDMVFFPNIWFVKEFSACNAYFGLFTKIKKESGISFWCTFFAWFFHTNALYLILYQLTKFQCHIFFPSQDIKQNLLLSSYLDDVINLKRFIFNHPPKQWPRGEWGGDRNTKIWVSPERKELFSWWSKKHFS